MKQEALYQTKEYDLFNHHEYQQPMSIQHVKKLAESMTETGFWRSKPLSVTRVGTSSKFTLIDGHHRLAAAKIAKVSVYYVIEDKSHNELIGQFNRTVRTWTNKSFAVMFAGEGHEDYKELLQYEQRGIPMRQVASLLRGECAHSCNAAESIRLGTFKIKTRRNIDLILEVISEFGEVASAVKSVIFIEALAVLLFVAEFDIDVLRARLRNNPRSLVKCNNRLQMMDLIEEIYNFRAREKIPLCLKAQEVMKDRKEKFLAGKIR